jgi:hypothetical protein
MPEIARRPVTKTKSRAAGPAPGAGGGAGAAGVPGYRGGTGSRESRSLPEVMNDALTSQRGDSLASAGPACAQVASALGGNDPEPLLAGVFWWRLLQTPFCADAADELGASAEADPVVVAYADATRFDLLFLDPFYEGEPYGLFLGATGTATAVSSHEPDLGVLDRLLQRSGMSAGLTPAILAGTSAELAANREFGMAVARAPEQTETCSLSPAVTLVDDDNEVVATLGTVLQTGKHGWIATTANHAVPAKATSVKAGNSSLRVVRRHSESDSCLLEIARALIEEHEQKGLAGPLRGLPPTQYAPATFFGGSSMYVLTHIHGYDPSVIDPQADEMSKIYTDADTAPGDSGAALIDSQDKILGFSLRRSRYGARIRFSVWVWAEQVYMAHDLFQYHDGDK